MNTDLIKQLELALAVERGEVPWNELQIRKTDQADQWVDCTMKPAWQFGIYEYRRKPKPLELWANIYENGVITAHRSQGDATECQPVVNRGHCTMHHMREATNE